ncbi:MAG: GIY-YIG nuclease family protein [Ruminococcus sp.]|nr:GIY-YIG nuclease family protein [Ruminococcus sp.]
MRYYIYILRCRGDVLYTGITTDIERRLAEHSGQAEGGAKFTRSRRPVELAALWSTEGRSSASKAEWRIKHLPRSRKLQIIGSPELLIELLEDPELICEKGCV